MLDNMKEVQVQFPGASPMQIADDIDIDVSVPDEEQRNITQQVRQTVAAYLKAVKEIVNEKYAHIKNWMPVHQKSARMPASLLAGGIAGVGWQAASLGAAEQIRATKMREFASQIPHSLLWGGVASGGGGGGRDHPLGLFP